MRRKIALFMSLALLLTACADKAPNRQQEGNPSDTEVTEQTTDEDALPMLPIIDETKRELKDPFTENDEEQLLKELENTLYAGLVEKMAGDGYYVENVNAVYISKEYLEELKFNSMTNIYFGYTLSDLDTQFQGKKYVFGPDENGATTVRELVAYPDEFEQDMMKSVAVGVGVIVICVTVSTVVTAGAGTVPTMSMIFTSPATEEAIAVIGSGLMTAIATGIATGMQTEDFDEALEAATVAGAQEITWNAIAGFLGEDVSLPALTGRPLGGIDTTQAARIQKETGYPLDIIKDFKSMDIYDICKAAGMIATIIDGESALVRDIDPDYVDETSGKTNLEKMQEGEAPLDPTGKAYQIYHIGKEISSAIAVFTGDEYKGDEEVSKEESKEFWMALANLIIEDALK